MILVLTLGSTSPIGGPLLLVDNVRFEPPTFEDIVRGSVSAYADRGMHATFQPNFGFGLEEAARLGNFDHFNWVQFVEEDSLLQDLSHPLHGQHSQGLQTMNGPSVVRFVDPAPGGFYYMTELAGAPGRFPVADRNVAYYDEEYNFPDGFFGDPPLLIPPDFVGGGPLSWRLAELGDNTRDENLAVPGLDTLKFTDRPSGADYVFLTCLAGIGGQVGLRILNRGGLETCFRWKYTWSREQAEILGYLLASGENPYSLGTTTFLGFVPDDGFSPDELDMMSQLEVASRSGQVDAPGTSLLLPLALVALVVTRRRVGSI